MTESIDAVRTASEIKAQYRRYLQSLLAVRDPVLDAGLQSAIDETPMLDKGPYLEATPPYAPGASLAELIDDGVLHPSFAKLESAALPLGRNLYTHQEMAIRKLRAGRNVVVATGTGSGKTESFLLPILDSLLREAAATRLGPGVRALLLYPMNALANDQMKRLRQVLRNLPEITFGRYTGETQPDPTKAAQMFDDLNPGEPRLPNELLSRQEMREAPPHLLVTNYAMLEYLLLRPQDIELFPTVDEGKWKFIVVDEAHVYDGAQGAEIAMLIRRLTDRVAPDRAVQCVATSATVGGDDNPTSVTVFASRLFGQPFEFDPHDQSRQDLIQASRIPAPQAPYWGPLEPSEYIRLSRSPTSEADVINLAAKHGYRAADGATALKHESTLVELRRSLALRPATFTSLAQTLYPDHPDREAGLSAMVELASGLQAPDGSAALSARYHLFLRATEGAFTCLSDSGPHVHLARHEKCTICSAHVFEIGSCKRCGAVHVLGRIISRHGRPVLVPRRATEPASWLVVGDAVIHEDEDEDAAVDKAEDLTGEKARLCTACGTLNDVQRSVCSSPTCGAGALRDVTRLGKRHDEIAGCLVCGGRGPSTVRVFETGADAAGAVIATSLYQNLPGSGLQSDHDRPGEGRKLLMFSDSRQAAAYFAPYLEDSYFRLQRRRLISQGLDKHGRTEAMGVDDVIDETRTNAADRKVFERGMTAQQQRRSVAPWVMAEVLSTDDRQSLEGLGLVQITLDDNGVTAPEPLLDLGLDSRESVAFLQELVRTLRQQGAVTMPESVAPNDEIFAPRLGPIYARGQGPEPVRKVLSWLPGKGTNRRIDYTRRLLARLGSDRDPSEILAGVWQYLTSGSSANHWLAGTTNRALGLVHQVDHRLLRLEWVGDRAPVYRCDRCRRLAPVSVRSTCSAIGCDGHLREYAPLPIAAERDHYRTVYQSMNAVPLKVLEHTAQWQSTEAARIQQDFVRGEVNALSCSTTFELGVDVGELQAVLMRNMPPTTANYVQRAGRAGRRAGAAALVVTYAQRRSHDLTRYATPETTMTGKMRAPYVPLENERLDRRHAHSIALAAFFRWFLDTTGRISRSAADFFLASDGGSAPVEQVGSYLRPVPNRVRESLERVLPPSVRFDMGVNSGHWVDVLCSLLDEVRVELSKDVADLEALRDDAATAKKFSVADRFQRVIRTLRERELLGFLANRNVIPKYGFPVDTVELRTNYSAADHAVGARLELTRDLAQAIHEYAPDATVAAGGHMWTSRGIYRLPGKDLMELNYRICRRCGDYRDSHEDVKPECPTCGEMADNAQKRLIIPEFGFVAARESARVGSRPPKRSWSGATFIVRQSDEARDRNIAYPGGVVEATVGPRGRLMAIADGPGGAGFWLCQWCGWASAALFKRPPRAHDHLFKRDKCTGPVQLINLGHHYETDLLRLDIRVGGGAVEDAVWQSVLYAILEAASERLEIARDNIDGTLSPADATTHSLMLFDTVPGGAGNVISIFERLEEVLQAALRRVSDCDCGRETSCYGCLRGYRNQREHDLLSRGAAADVLGLLLLGSGDHEEVELLMSMAPAWIDLYGQAVDSRERHLVQELWSSGAEPPEIGIETEQGIPVGIAWPSRHIAVDTDLPAEDRESLHQGGWSLVKPEVESITRALANPTNLARTASGSTRNT